jgi:hypothetical protein
LLIMISLIKGANLIKFTMCSYKNKNGAKFNIKSLIFNKMSIF